MKVIDKQELIKVTLPAMDKELTFQEASFFSFFSTKGSPSLICNLPGLIGTPKYFKEKLPI